MIRRYVPSTLFLLAAVAPAFQNTVAAQPEPQVKAEPSSVTYLRCGTLLDGKSNEPRKNILIEVKDEKIENVRDFSTDLLKDRPSRSTFISLAKDTCLPGLIDTHTHVLLQGDQKPGQYDEQLLKWSLPYRTIWATQAARRALEYGFTTIRDLETEGAGYADVDIRNAINQGVIAGPRMQVATRALDVTGAYPLLGYSWEVAVPHGVQVVDGPEEARKAVREQISYGADWIKLYADRGYRIRPDGVLDGIPTFTPEELRAIVDEAHREHHKVAAHAMGLNGVHNAVAAGVDSIEHGIYISDEDMRTMAERGIFYVPTLYIVQYAADLRASSGDRTWQEFLRIHAQTFHRAVEAGVKIAFGTDAGGFEWTINPAKEFALMVKDGMTPVQAIRSATVTAADLLATENEVGSIEPGSWQTWWPFQAIRLKMRAHSNT